MKIQIAVLGVSADWFRDEHKEEFPLKILSKINSHALAVQTLLDNLKAILPEELSSRSGLSSTKAPLAKEKTSVMQGSPHMSMNSLQVGSPILFENRKYVGFLVRIQTNRSLLSRDPWRERAHATRSPNAP